MDYIYVIRSLFTRIFIHNVEVFLQLTIYYEHYMRRVPRLPPRANRSNKHSINTVSLHFLYSLQYSSISSKPTCDDQISNPFIYFDCLDWRMNYS